MSIGGDHPVVERVLLAFADLARSGAEAELRSVDPAWAAWAEVPMTAFDGAGEVAIAVRTWRKGGGERLRAMARVRGDTAVMHLGFLWLHAPGRHIGPLVSVPVTLRSTTQRLDGHDTRTLAFDIEELPTLWDPDLAPELATRWLRRVAALAEHTSVPGTDAEVRDLADDFARAAGADKAPYRIDPGRPVHELHQRAVVPRCVLFLREVRRPAITTATVFREWAHRDLRGTALTALYAPTDAEAPAPAEPPVDWLTPMPLDAAQRAALDAGASGPIAVVSGPPGTGKSQTVAAMALSAVAGGQRVLVAAPSDAAVGALEALLRRAGATTPVIVGGGRHERLRLADRLAAGATAGRGHERSDDDRRRAVAHYHLLREAMEEQLAVEAASTPAAEADELVARHVAPGFFDADADHVALGEIAARAPDGGGWWWPRRRARRAAAALRASGRSDADVDVDRLGDALRLARRVRAAAVTRADGGLTLDAVWPTLQAAEDAARRATAVWLDDFAASRRAGRSGAQAVAVVAAALRAGRDRRRELLASVPGRALTDALPIWIATLADIEDLLPPTPRMFDVVIVDEAAQVDQPSAAVALARAGRAVVVGDPQQLRHVSFLADDRVREVLGHHGLDADPLLAGRLDPRRMTLFDAAAGVAAVQQLDTHYRSAPHLIGFSARRFYEGRLTVATAHPGNDRADHIDVVAVDGDRSEDGVNRAEVAWIVEHLRARLAAGARSVGVVTPFRAHADAIEAAVTDAVGLDDLDRLDLRIGTVHGFQGCERGEVVVSLAATTAEQLGFVNDRHLLNVMVTRARERMTVLSSLGDRATGLVADLLRYAADPAGGVTPPEAPTGWVAEVAAELRRVGIPVVARYPFGRDDIDLVVGDGDDAFAVECAVHLDGPAAHVERHLALRRRGWVQRDFFASRWQERLAEVAVRLAVSTRRADDQT